MSDASDRLAEAYLRIASEERAAAGEPCPPSDELAMLLAGDMPRRGRKRILAHVSRCPACAEDVRALLQADREIEELIAGLPDAGTDRAPGKRFLRAWKPRLLRPVALGATLLILLGLAYVFIIRSRPAVPSWRGGADTVVPVSPVRSAVVAGSWEFIWEAVPGAVSYTVEVVDAAFSLVWRSEPIDSTRVRPPEEVRAVLRSGASYYWSVSARLATGRVVKSRLTEFVPSR